MGRYITERRVVQQHSPGNSIRLKSLMFDASAAAEGADPKLPHVTRPPSRAELWAGLGTLPSPSLQQVQA